MDALVETDVLGIDLAAECHGDMYDEDGDHWSCTDCDKTGTWGEDFAHTREPRHRSTDIAAAWEVLEWLLVHHPWHRKALIFLGKTPPWEKQSWCVMVMQDYWDGGYPTDHEPSSYNFTIEANAAPLAICRAALKAVGYE